MCSVTHKNHTHKKRHPTSTTKVLLISLGLVVKWKTFGMVTSGISVVPYRQNLI